MLLKYAYPRTGENEIHSYYHCQLGIGFGTCTIRSRLALFYEVHFHRFHHCDIGRDLGGTFVPVAVYMHYDDSHSHLQH